MLDLHPPQLRDDYFTPIGHYIPRNSGKNLMRVETHVLLLRVLAWTVAGRGREQGLLLEPMEKTAK